MMEGGVLLAGVLFDLDGTLLDIDLDAFFREYFTALGPVVAEALGSSPGSRTGLNAVLQSTEAMYLLHPGLTNRGVFNQRFRELTGADLDLNEYGIVFENFYATVFPTLRGTIKPHAGARTAVKCALDLGLKVAIATNPIFPRSAIEERMRWADVFDLPIDVVTTYETMHATKPHPAYFIETAEMLGIAPSDALMVGDDRVLDMSAADVGMRTYYVGGVATRAVDFAGTLEQLIDLLPRLTESET